MTEIKLHENFLTNDEIQKFLGDVKQGYLSLYYKAVVLPIIIKEKEDILVEMGLDTKFISNVETLKQAHEKYTKEELNPDQFKTQYTTIWYDIQSKRGELENMQSLLDESYNTYKILESKLLS